MLEADVPLHGAIASVPKLTTLVIRDFVDGADLKAALRASSWLPMVVRGTATFRGERALDGALLTSHPWPLAAEDGCTHILSLSSSATLAPRRRNPVALRYASRYLDGIEPGLGQGYLQGLEDNQDNLRRLRRWLTEPTPDPYVLELGPMLGAPPIKRHEMDRTVIIDAARHGFEVMYSAIEKLPPPDGTGPSRVVPRLSFHHPDR